MNMTHNTPIPGTDKLVPLNKFVKKWPTPTGCCHKHH